MKLTTESISCWCSSGNRRIGTVLYESTLDICGFQRLNIGDQWFAHAACVAITLTLAGPARGWFRSMLKSRGWHCLGPHIADPFHGYQVSVFRDSDCLGWGFRPIPATSEHGFAGAGPRPGACRAFWRGLSGYATGASLSGLAATRSDLRRILSSLTLSSAVANFGRWL